MLNPAMVIVSIVVLVYAGIRFYRTVELLKIKVTEDTNDHGKAVSVLRDLLAEADEKMIMYDDGNSMDESIYDDRSVVEAIQAKLQDNPGFRIDCMLNSVDDTLFRRTFQNEPRVEITQRKGERSSLHYKIIDDGRKAHVSCHALGEEERPFKIIDATVASARARKVALGAYFSDFTEHHA